MGHPDTRKRNHVDRGIVFGRLRILESVRSTVKCVSLAGEDDPRRLSHRCEASHIRSKIVNRFAIQRHGIIGTAPDTDATRHAPIGNEDCDLAVLAILPQDHLESVIRTVDHAQRAPRATARIDTDRLQWLAPPDPRNRGQRDPDHHETSPYESGREIQSGREEEQVERIDWQCRRNDRVIEGWEHPGGPED
jgi:hypothetical protein